MVYPYLLLFPTKLSSSKFISTSEVGNRVRAIFLNEFRLLGSVGLIFNLYLQTRVNNCKCRTELEIKLIYFCVESVQRISLIEVLYYTGISSITAWVIISQRPMKAVAGINKSKWNDISTYSYEYLQLFFLSWKRLFVVIFIFVKIYHPISEIVICYITLFLLTILCKSNSFSKIIFSSFILVCEIYSLIYNCSNFKVCKRFTLLDE